MAFGLNPAAGSSAICLCYRGISILPAKGRGGSTQAEGQPPSQLKKKVWVGHVRSKGTGELHGFTCSKAYPGNATDALRHRSLRL